MVIRRAFYLWLFPSAFFLPLWVLFGWGFFHEGSGWSFLGLLILCPIIFASCLLIGVLIIIRGGVRRVRAVSWLDAGLISVWNAALIAFGFFPAGATGWLALLCTAAFIAVFCSSVAQLVTGVRTIIAAPPDPTVIIVNERRRKN